MVEGSRVADGLWWGRITMQYCIASERGGSDSGLETLA